MELIVKKEPNTCKHCSGFGVFKCTGEWKLVPCPKCNSIHIETLGLSYRESDSNNFKFYLKETILDKITRILK